MTPRRKFIKQTAQAGAATALVSMGWTAKSYGNILGANDKVRCGVIGFSDRHRQSHIPAFMHHYKEMNFDIVAVSDIWKYRREEGVEFLKKKMEHDIIGCKNNEELYALKDIDAVFISTADFQHALHTIEALKAKKDIYVEKPFAETMEDNRAALKAAKE